MSRSVDIDADAVSAISCEALRQTILTARNARTCKNGYRATRSCFRAARRLALMAVRALPVMLYSALSWLRLSLSTSTSASSSIPKNNFRSSEASKQRVDNATNSSNQSYQNSCALQPDQSRIANLCRQRLCGNRARKGRNRLRPTCFMRQWRCRLLLKRKRANQKKTVALLESEVDCRSTM